MSGRRQPVVLLVDDEAHVLSSLRRGLRRGKFTIRTAREGRGALEIMAAHSIDLVISDHRMPGMSGVELLTTIRTRWPQTERILLSGWTEEISPSELKAAGLFEVLSKPWDDGELRRAIRGALALAD